MVNLKDKEVENLRCGICESDNKEVFQFEVDARSCICIDCLLLHPKMAMTKSDLDYTWRKERTAQSGNFHDQINNAPLPRELKRFMNRYYDSIALMNDI